MPDALRFSDLPAVHELLDRLSPALDRYPRALLVDEIRRALADIRREIAAGRDPSDSPEARVTAALAALERPSLVRVVNATGVVLHTNLGRAPLGPAAFPVAYTNLEYDLATGRRGKRDTHAAALLHRLLGAPAIVVNNNAAAIFLALHELAAGGEVLVSRGELIEIGDGFRIPEIMARSGAVLREVGTTNRTHLDDFRDAITDRTRLLLRVHPSNFHMTGFTARVPLRDLAALGRERGLPVYEDLGSGCLADLRPFGVDEPRVSDSLDAGAGLVSFSGDKLLGGPQAGILAGKPDLVQRLRRNPLFRALRVDKLTYRALEDTLRNTLLERWEAIPAIALIRLAPAAIYGRAEALLKKHPEIDAQILPGKSVIGGGSTPDQSLDTWLLSPNVPNPVDAEKRLRAGDPPVIARVEEDRLLLDLRTVLPEEEEELATRIAKLFSA